MDRKYCSTCDKSCKQICVYYGGTCRRYRVHRFFIKIFKRERIDVYKSITNGLHEVELMQHGKMKKKTWNEFKEEIEKESE